MPGRLLLGRVHRVYVRDKSFAGFGQQLTGLQKQTPLLEVNKRKQQLLRFSFSFFIPRSITNSELIYRPSILDMLAFLSWQFQARILVSDQLSHCNFYPLQCWLGGYIFAGTRSLPPVRRGSYP